MPGNNVVGLTSVLHCIFGVTPTPLIVLPDSTVIVDVMLVGNMMQAFPIVNIPTFGLCVTITNPEVATATAAAFGVLIPMPCIPMTEVWITEDFNELIDFIPAITQSSFVMCDWGGMINVIFSGQITMLTA